MNKVLLTVNCFFSFILLVLYLALIPVPPAEEEQTFLRAAQIDCRAIGKQSWRLTFPEHMIEQQAVGQMIDPACLSIAPHLPFEARWESSTVLYCEAMTKPKLAHRYRLNLHQPLRTLAGKPIAEGAHFDLGGQGPVVTGCLPSLHGRSMGIMLRFNMPIDCNNLHEIIHVSDQEDQPQTFSYEIVDPKTIRLDLKQELHSPVLMQIQIDAGLASTIGPMRMARNFKQQLSFGKKLNYNRYRSYGDSVTLRFNHSLRKVDPNYLSIKGIDDYTITCRSWGVEINGAFKPGQQYLIQLRSGFPGHGEVSLPRNVDIHAQIDDLPRSLEIKERGLVLSSKAEQRIEIESVNMEEAEVEVRKVHPENYVFLCQNYDRLPSAMYGKAKKGILRLPLKRNETVSCDLSLSSYISKGENGLYELRIRDRHRYPNERKLIHVTDMGMYVRINAQDALVYCSSIADATPIPYANVVLYSKSNQVLGAGVTDEAGRCHIPLALESENDQPFVAVAKTHTDCAFIDAKRFHVGVLPGAVSGRDYVAALPGYAIAEAYVHVNRGIVRPGGQVAGYINVRNAKREALAEQDVRIMLYDGKSTLVREQTLRLNEVGTCAFECDLPVQRPSGHWKIKVMSQQNELFGQAGFLVEDFEPERIHMKINETQWTLGNNQMCQLSAHWLEGGPATDMPIDLYVRYEKVLRPFPDYKEFSFGLVQQSNPGAVKPVKAKTTSTGGVDVRIPNLRSAHQYQYVKAHVLAELTGPSGRPIRAHQEIPVKHGRQFVGVACKSDQLRVVILDTDKKLVSGDQALDVLIEEMDWRYEYRNKRWQWHRGFHTVKAFELKAVAGNARYDLRDIIKNNWRSHRITISTQGPQKISASCYRGTSGMWQRPDHLPITVADTCVPGEELQIEVEAAFDGPAYVSLEGVGIHDMQRHNLNKGVNTIRVMVPRDIVEPNVHVIVCQQFPQAQTSKSKHWFVMGAQSVQIKHAKQIEILASNIPDQIEVGGDLALHLETAGAAYAYIAVVDQGILQITNHPNPDPNGFFHASRRIRDQTLSSFMRLMQHVRYPSLPGGGGALDALPVMSSYLDTSQERKRDDLAIHQALIKIPESGILDYSCNLGEYVGRVRTSVVLIAQNDDAALSQDVRVTSDYSIRLSAPTHLNHKDQCAVPVTVANRTEKSVSAKIVIKHDEHLIRDEVHEIIAGQRKTIFVQVRTSDQEQIKLSGELIIDGEVLARGHSEIVVNNPSRFSQLEMPMYIQNSWQPAIGEWSSLSGLTLKLHAHPLDAAQASIDDLIAYPYGCLEQTTSRCMALLAAYRARVQRGDSMEGSDISYFMAEGIQRLQLLRSRDGGLSWWPNNNADAYPYGSLYAYDYLLSSRELSFDVPEAFLKQMRSYAQGVLRNPGSKEYHCYALYLLARHGDAVRPKLIELMKTVTTREDVIYLGLAAAHYQSKEIQRKIMTMIDGFGYNQKAPHRLSSKMRTLVNELHLRQTLDQQDPQIAQIYLHIINEYMQRWRRLHTNEKAYLVMGLALFDKRHDESPALSIEIDGVQNTVNVDDKNTVQIDPSVDLSSLRIHTSTPCFVSLLVQGQKVEVDEIEGQRIGLSRKMIDVQSGKTVTSLKYGRVYRVEVLLDNPDQLADVAITDILPSGCAYVPKRIDSFYKDKKSGTHVHIESRGQRVHIFPGKPRKNSAGKQVFHYHIRSVYKGNYACLPMTVESMYQPQYRAQLNYAKHLQID